MAFLDDIELHLKAGVSAIYVESSEWGRFHADIEECCTKVDKTLCCWNKMDHLSYIIKPREESNNDLSDVDLNDFDLSEFTNVLKYLAKGGLKDTVCVLELVDSHLQDAEAAEQFAVMLRKLPLHKSHVVILSPVLNIPKILEREFAVLDLSLPGRGDIRTLLTNEAKKYKISSPDDANPILDAVRGLGATEIRNAFAKAAVQYGGITAEEIPFLIAEKEQIIRKTGYLTFVRTDEKMDSVGGLIELKKWLRTRKHAFGKKAREAKLNAPKGVLLLGVPGTGKSLCAKAVAREWKMPLLRLDMGSIFSSGVGDSEANMRNAIKTAEGLAPCVLWIDEIEKGVSGSTGGELDGGTSMRVFGSFLTWMQEKQKEVFVFATANNIARLPPEMLRKGRFDEIFFVDLPGTEERKKIFKIHLSRKRQTLESIDIDKLARETEGFSGSEIETIVNEALFTSYESVHKGGKTPVVSETNLLEEKSKITPLSATMKETIGDLRKWAKSRCRKASDSNEEPKAKNLNIGVSLRTEMYNPFKKDKNK